MSNRKFNLDNEVQPEIHFRLLSISASKFENVWTSFPHSHHFTEIFFIKDGTGRMLIENESLPVSSNSLVVIGAQVTHTKLSNSSCSQENRANTPTNNKLIFFISITFFS